MKYIILLFCMLTVPAAAGENSSGKFAVGYYPAYNRAFYNHTLIEYNNLTHICHAFIAPDTTGKLEVPEGFLYPELIETAHKNGVKVLISLGGWGRDKGFRPASADAEVRKAFVEDLTEFCKENGYDGADIDWEYPFKEDRDNFTLMMKELRESFDEAGVELLTAALPSIDYRGGFDLLELNKYFDWFGIMTYDFHGPWMNHAGHNSPLYSSPYDSCGSVDNSIKFFLGKGIPAEKLLIGMAFYGRNFNASVAYPYAEGAGSSNHFSASALIKEGWKYNWDKVCRVPYLTDAAGTQMITFDDRNSIREKSRYILNKGLKGTIVWALSQDFDGTQQPLLDELGSSLLRAPQVKPAQTLTASAQKGEDGNYLLKWNPAAGAYTYEVETAGDSSFNNILFSRRGVETNNIQYGFPQGEGSFYWRVRGVNHLGAGEWGISPEVKAKSTN